MNNSPESRNGRFNPLGRLTKVGRFTAAVGIGAAVSIGTYAWGHRAHGENLSQPVPISEPAYTGPAIVVNKEDIPQGELSIFAEPGISLEHYIAILQRNDSPLIKEPGAAERTYDYMENMGVDPAEVLGIFYAANEMGTKPDTVFQDTKNAGHIQLGDPESYNADLGRLLTRSEFAGKIKIIQFNPYANRGNQNDKFRSYSTVEDGMVDLVNYLVLYEVENGKFTVQQVLPGTFAPKNDLDNPDGVVNTVVKLYNKWKQEEDTGSWKTSTIPSRFDHLRERAQRPARLSRSEVLFSGENSGKIESSHTSS